MHFRQLLPAFAAAALVVSGCDTTPTPTEPAAPASTEAASVTKQSSTQIIPGRYIVVFKSDVAISTIKDLQTASARRNAADIDRVYTKAVKGFAGYLNDAELSRYANDPRVAYIEPDREFTIQITGNDDLEDMKRPSGGGGGGGTASQTTPWGITRVGGAGDGTGKRAWIIDSGIDLDHPDLNVNTLLSKTFVSGTSTADDGNGHGTHVAGTVAAKNNTIGVVGVAAGAQLVAVRVLSSSGSGTYSGVIAGVDYVANNASSGDVANMSLGGPVSTSLDDAVRNLASKGVKVVIAAGNDGANAANYSPARVNATNVYTISAIGTNNCLPYWSNYGLGVDYAAPGVNILSTWRNGGTNTISGTSMAAPHVAGILLLGNVATDGTACSDPDGSPDPIAHR